MSREDAERIAFLTRDVGREFVDQASVKSSATRACRLYSASGLSLEEFFDVVQAARIRTKRYQGMIKAEPVERSGQMVRQSIGRGVGRDAGRSGAQIRRFAHKGQRGSDPCLSTLLGAGPFGGEMCSRRSCVGSPPEKLGIGCVLLSPTLSERN